MSLGAWEAGRNEARKAAEAALRDRGFEPADGPAWTARLTAEGIGVEVRLVLPEDFPDCLPDVRIERRSLPRRIPHVDRQGKLCLAASTGVLIDADQPGALVRDTLEKAQALLAAGLSGANASDLIAEFLAYWDPGADGQQILSICRAGGAARRIRLLTLPARSVILAADDAASGRTWLERRGLRSHGETGGWFHPLATPFSPPDFDERLLPDDVLRNLEAHSTGSDWTAFATWRAATRLPWTILCAMPIPGQDVPTVFGVTVRRAVGDNRKKALRGFRPASVPVGREYQFARNQPVTRSRVHRLDPPYLLPRAGGSPDFMAKTVAVVGCGAVGSRLIEKLAGLGIGTLRVIDNDILLPENLHRHTLGAEYLFMNKAAALKNALGKRLPHLAVEDRENSISQLMREEPAFVVAADLVCIALGDETVERRLDQGLQFAVPRIHAWVEPLGVGGHILVTGCADGEGCFHCLFRSDEAHGLVNRTAFAGAGQAFDRSLAGCAGSFTPFTALDADRVALEAARLASLILSGAQRRNVLRSWFGDPAPFLTAGFRLSPRAALFRPCEWQTEQAFRDRSCVCRQWSR